MQMIHPNSGTFNIKYINYTDSETKRQEIFPEDSLSSPEGSSKWEKEEGTKKMVR